MNQFANLPRPRKRFGQHFLSDSGVVEAIDQAIVQPIVLSPGQRSELNVVEIGPGRGALTHPLAARLNRLDVVEVDRDLARYLEQGFAHHEGITIHNSDALKFDYCQMTTETAKCLVVGNLPYNISSPLLFHLLTQLDCIAEMVFMLQKEVAERIAAAPATRQYGRLSVMIQVICDVEHLFDVPPQAFTPPPKVQSSVIRLRPKPQPAEIVCQSTFEEVVKRLFGQRRKTLRNALKGIVDDSLLLTLDIPPSIRGETLAVTELVRLANGIARSRCY